MPDDLFGQDVQRKITVAKDGSAQVEETRTIVGYDTSFLRAYSTPMDDAARRQFVASADVQKEANPRLKSSN